MSSIKGLMPIDADMLRDLVSSDFEANIHNHDSDYYSMDPNAVVGQKAIYVNNEISSQIPYNNFAYFKSWTTAGVYNWTVPAGTKALYIMCTGGGGGGGKAIGKRWNPGTGSYGSSIALACPGSGGSTGIKYYDSTIPSSLYIIVGAKGLGNIDGDLGSSGATGGASYVSTQNNIINSICHASGGYGGGGWAATDGFAIRIAAQNNYIFDPEYNAVNDIIYYPGIANIGYACQLTHPNNPANAAGDNMNLFVKFPTGGKSLYGIGGSHVYQAGSNLLLSPSSTVFYSANTSSFFTYPSTIANGIQPKLGGGGYGGVAYCAHSYSSTITGSGGHGADGTVFIWGYK